LIFFFEALKKTKTTNKHPTPPQKKTQPKKPNKKTNPELIPFLVTVLWSWNLW